MIDLQPAPWRRQAACLGVGVEQFVPDARAQPTEPPAIVTRLCPGCPVREECESYGRSTGSSGWWGGVYLCRGFALPEWRALAQWAKQLVTRNDNPSRDVRAEIALGRPIKLTQPLVDQIRQRYAEGGTTQRDLSEDFGVAPVTVKRITQRRQWRGPHNIKRGSEHPNARLTRDDVIEIRQRLSAGEGQAALAECFGVSTTCICNISTGRRWSSV